MIYSYQAKDGVGRTVTGSLEAADERSAALEVRAQGYFPIRLVPQDETGSSSAGAATAATNTSRAQMLLRAVWSGVSLDELALFYRQFGAMLRAGVPVYQCLSTLTGQTRNAVFHQCLTSVSHAVLNGRMLSDAMSAYPWIFTDFHRAMVTAGEASGRLDLMFSRLADALEQEQALRRNVQRETLYPKIVVVCAFLLPPLFYLFGPNPAAYLQHAVLPLAILGAAVVGTYVLNRLGMQAQDTYHMVLATLPGIGGTVRMIAMARFARALASLYAAGINMPEALRIAANACGNAYIAKRIKSAIGRIQAGASMGQALGATGILPPMVMSMLATGEQTGSLDQTMDKVADFYEQESAVRLHQASVALGVAALLLAAAIVFKDVLSFYTGYYSSMMEPD